MRGLSYRYVRRYGSRYYAAYVLCLSVLTGCSALGTYNPATDRNEFIFISTPEEISLGRSIHQQLSGQFQILESAPDAQRLRRIGLRLAQVSDRRDYEYQFFLVDKDELNAFTIPGGRIYMFLGLMNRLKTDDQIAFVLAHEIGHCAARHTVKKFQAAMGYDLISSIALGQVGGEARNIVSMSSGMVMNIVFSAYGRRDEYEADRLAVKYLRQAGYKAQAGIEALSILQNESKDAGAPLVLRTHPHLADRIKAVREEIERGGSSAGPEFR